MKTRILFSTQTSGEPKIGGRPMDYLIQFQINLLAFVVMGIVFFILQKRTEVTNFSKILLRWIILFGMIALVLEPLTWIFDRKQFFGAFFWEYSTNFLLALMGPVLAGLMLSYVDYKLFLSRKRLYSRLLYMEPAMVMLGVLIINGFVPWYFRVDPVTHVYSVGPIYWLGYALIGAVYVFMIVFLMKHRRAAPPHLVRTFFSISLFPIVGLTVQWLEVRLLFSWTAIAAVVLVVYAFLESTSGERDYLTNLYTRLSYETYVRHLAEGKKSFGICLIDLDKFKTINDRFGHQVGDRVLVEFGKILVKAFHPNRLVARLAGDEFMIVIEEDLDDLAEKHAEIRRLCRDNPLPEIQELAYSSGYQRFVPPMTLDDLYHQVDQKMYAEKTPNPE